MSQPLMDHYNATVLNGGLVSTRRGLHVSKTKHQGTRFVNSFAPSKPTPSRRRNTASRVDGTKSQEHTFTFVSSPKQPPKQRSRAPSSPISRTVKPNISTPSSSPRSGRRVLLKRSSNPTSRATSPTPILDFCFEDLSVSSPASSCTDASTPVSDILSAELIFDRVLDVENLLQPCGIAQANIDTLNQLIFFSESVTLARKTPLNLSQFDSHVFAEMRMRLNSRLLQYPRPLFDDTNLVDDLYSNSPSDPYAQQHLGSSGDYSFQEAGSMADIMAFPLANVVNPLIRAASMIYLEKLIPQYHAGHEYRRCLSLLNQHVRNVVLLLYEQESYMQDPCFALDNLASTNCLRPLIIWVCIVAYAVSTVGDPKDKPIDLVAFEDCLGLLIGPNPKDVDGLLDSDFELCQILPVQELGVIACDDREILKQIMIDYEERLLTQPMNTFL
ncbi:Fc.00g076840.m01.CDS01 [Cosmosporella sp. VM-42]